MKPFITPFELSIRQGRELVRSRELTVRQWTESCLDRVASLEGKVKAWALCESERAIHEAERLDAKRAQGELGALGGAPIGVKDIINTSDMPTCMGSPLWEGFTPGNDARVVYYLREADGLILGKTATAEFAVHSLGKTLNPHRAAHTPGTSSSGSAAAVAAAMIPAALGTQTAGSIIRPASFCGIYGFKPSFGLLARTGMLKTTDSLDTVGFFTRHAEDLEILFDTLRVKGPNYPVSDAALSDSARQKVSGRPWKIALIKTHTWKNAEKYVQEALESYFRRLGGLREVEVGELELGPEFDHAHEIHATIYEKTLSYYFKEEFKNHTLISGVFYEMIDRGNKTTLEAYTKALEEQNRLAAKLDQMLSAWDIGLSLATATEAPLREVPEKDDPSLIWTLCRVPALGAPLFKSPSGLPFGGQFIARRYNDLLLLNFVRFLEKAGLAPKKAPAPESDHELAGAV